MRHALSGMHRSFKEGFELVEDDLREVFSRSRGPGGQHVNKVATRVTLKHLPSGLSVSVQSGRSQAGNRRKARELLCDLLRKRASGAIAARRQAREKERRRSDIRPPRVKRRILESKRRRSEVKARRRKDFSGDA